VGFAICLVLGAVACNSNQNATQAPGAQLGSAQLASTPRAQHVRITTLSTMMTDWPTLTGAPFGEWGYAALVEVDDKKLLFDTGKDPTVILHNLDALGISLADVDTVVLSHRHDDHTGGLVALQQKFPSGLRDVIVGAGFAGAATSFRVVGRPTSLLDMPYVQVTGPIPRTVEEHDIEREQLAVPEDQALVIDTVNGLIVITGCGHAGVVNTLDAAQAMFPQRPVLALLGGLHLYERTPSFGFASLEAYLDAVGQRLRRAAVRYLVGSHCTGLESLYWLRVS